MAKILQVGTTTYRRWETGEREMPLHILIEIAKYYNVSLDYIVGLSKEPKAQWTANNKTAIKSYTNMKKLNNSSKITIK